MNYSDISDLWINGGTPSGFSGTAIDPAMIAPVKVTAVNSWTMAASGHVDVPISEVEGFMNVEGILPAMQAWAAANTSPSAALTAIVAMNDTLNSARLSVVAMSDPTTYTAVSNMLAAIQAVGLVTSDQSAALLAMANPPPIPWWRTIGNTKPMTLADAVAIGLP